MTKLGHDSLANFDTLEFWTHLKCWIHTLQSTGATRPGHVLASPSDDQGRWACHHRRNYLAISLKRFGTCIERKVVSCHRV